MDEPCRDYLQPYKEAVAAHGPGFLATLWSSEEGQRRRFDVMIDLACFHQAVIIDVGCGVGDFARRLIDRHVAFERYLGVDALSEMVAEAARKRLPRCEFAVVDVLADARWLGLQKVDFVCFSGTLNTMNEATARQLVLAAFTSAQQGVVFNFLSDRCGEPCAARDLGPARRFNTVAWIDWALTLSPRVAFTQDYLDGHDATILIRHARTTSPPDP